MLSGDGCPENILAIKDALEVLEGRWKILIMVSLTHKNMRFRELGRQIGISDKMLSKELKSLETHKLVHREVKNHFPPEVEYSITPHGMSLDDLINELYLWGQKHRNEIIGV